MADNFGLKIGIEGEKEFKNALKEINQSFKLLGSEMTLVAAQFDKQDKSLQAITARNAVLNKEIDQQKEKIATLKQALQNANDSFGENDKRTKDWAIQLNNAQAELIGMERELDNNNKALSESSDGFDSAGREAEGFGKAVGGIGDELGEAGKETDAFGRALDSAGKEIGDAEKETDGLGKALDDAGNEMDEAGKETKNLGDEMDETGKKTSIFGEVLKANLAADAIKAGLKAIVDMVKEVGRAVKDYVSSSMEMASAAAESQTLLTQVMRNTMDASDDEVKSLLELAAAQEKVGVVSKTAQTTALAELASFVERKQSLEEMLPVMNDYIAYQYGATASSEQARNVATALGKAINGSIDGLAKQGFTLTQAQKEWFKTASEMERVQFITEMVGESMNGVNAALAQTDAGKMSSLKTVMDNTKISVGTLANEFKAQILGQMLPSISSLSDAFLGVIHGEGSVEDMAKAFDEVFIEILHLIDEFLPKLLELGSQILTAIVTGIANNMDTIVAGALNVIDMLSKTLLDLLPMIVEAGTKLLLGLLDGIIKALPTLVEAAIEIVVALADGIGDALPTLIPAIVEAVILIATTLLDHMDKILEAAMKIIEGLAKGLIAALPKLIEMLPKIITSIVDFVISSLPQIIELGIKLVVELVAGLIKAIPQLVASLPKIVLAILEGIGKAAVSIVDIGKNIVKGLWDGIAGMISWISGKIKDFIGGIVSGVKGLLGIKSPSTVFRGIGDNMGRSLGMGFAEAMDKVSEDIQDAIPTSFDIEPNVDLGGGVKGGGMGAIMPTGPLVMVQQMIVRNEDDIRRISQELYNLMQTGSRAQGKFSPA